MTRLLEDLRFARRIWTKNPAFTAIAVLTLALGIGANTAIFSVVNGVLLRPLPYSDPGRLVMISERSHDSSLMSVAWFNFLDWQKLNQTCDGLAAFRDDDFNLTGSGDPERLHGQMVSGSLFSILGVRPVLGRTFLSQEDQPGGAPVVLISEKLWRRRFAAGPGILNRTLTLNGVARTVAGVLPAFEFYGDHDLWTPVAQWNSFLMRARMFHAGLHVVARRKPGATLEQTRADFDRIGRVLAAEYPKDNGGHGVAVAPLTDEIVGNVRPTLRVLFAAVGFVLLIACANISNLLLSRAASRRREIAVRMALGASRARVLRQLLTETAVFSLAGGALGLALASWSAGAILKLIPNGIPRMEEIGTDGRVLAFTVLASLVTGVVFGLAPALELSSAPSLGRLSESGRGTITGRGRVRDVLVLCQIAVALVLLVGATLMMRTMWNLHAVNPGLDPHNVLTLKVGLSPASSSSPAAIRTAYQQLIERIGRIPGVESAASILDLPLGGDAMIPVAPDGRVPSSCNDMPVALWYAAGPGYLKAMGIPLLHGRFFDARDEKGPTPAVIDEVMARTFFPGENAVGKRLRVGCGNEPPLEIVGIVGHVKHWGLDTDAGARVRSQLYTPFARVPDSFLTSAPGWNTIVIRTRSNPISIADAVRAQVIGADRDQPVYNVRTMEQIVAGTFAQRRFSMLLLSGFATIALLLAAVGVYGGISYSVSQRTRELGIRMALGATRANVLGLVVGRGAVIVVAGVAAGSLLSVVTSRALSTLLFGVSATDPFTLAAVGGILAAIALLASYIPARRAAGVDPMAALRYE